MKPGKGFTLIEAVVGTALLGTLLVGMLMTSANLTRQERQSDKSAQAAAVADELLMSWWKDPSKLPRSAKGQVQSRNGWSWSTASRDWQDPDRDKMKAQIVTLKVFAPGDDVNAAAQVEIALPPAPVISATSRNAKTQGNDTD